MTMRRRKRKKRRTKKMRTKKMRTRTRICWMILLPPQSLSIPLLVVKRLYLRLRHSFFPRRISKRFSVYFSRKSLSRVNYDMLCLIVVIS
jgi:hypothetical protein